MDLEDAAATGMLRIEGWLFFFAGEIEHVRAVIGGKNWPGQYGFPRPDVGKIYPATPQAAFSGFSITVPVRLGSTFELKLEAKDPAGKFRKFLQEEISIPLSTKKGQLPRPDPQLGHYEGLQRGYVCWLDQPDDWKKLPRRFRIVGWCFSKNGETISAIRARVGKREFPGNFGLFRADVAANFGDRPGTFKSGFDVAVEIPRIPVCLHFEARDERGTWNEIFSRKVHAPLIDLRASRTDTSGPVGDYATWIKRYDTLRAADRRGIKAHIRRFAKQPRISIVMPVYNPSADHLRRALESVRKQIYPNWELCIVDDASSEPHVRSILSKYQKLDSRIKVLFRDTNGGIVAASNDALALVQSEWLALMDHDDELAPAAFYFVAHEINRHPDARLIYTDEDKLDLLGRRTTPHFKSDWNWQLFLAQNFLSHLCVFDSQLVKELGFRPGFDGSQDYDLVLRFFERIKPAQIRHIPRVLYHWRMSAKSAALDMQAKPRARDAAIRTVQEHLDRSQIAATVVRSGLEDFQRIRYQLPNEKPTVSIIILTRDHADVLRTCLQSILEKTTYPAFDILLLDNGSTEAAAIAYLEELAREPRLRIVRCDEEFNFGRLNNLAVSHTTSEFVALLNNDLTVITPDWLQEMVSQGMQPGVGAVGARLLFPDNRIQHAGVILGAGGGGVADHAHKGLPRDNHGYFARALLAQELSAVTAACMLVRRKVYLEVNGFEEEHLKVAFNDVDFCLRLKRHGYRVIYTPYAEFYHHESASRGLEDNIEKHRRFNAEVDYIKRTWGEALAIDPFYNPNLRLDENLFTLAFPPRVDEPWRGR